MNKRKMKTIIPVFVAMAIFVIAFTVFLAGSRYKIKNGTITAAEIDISDVILSDTRQPDSEIETIVQYYKDNGINTAILALNSGTSSIVDMPGYDYIYINNENFSQKDIISQLKKALEKEKIQLYISLDCTDMEDSEVLATIEYIKKNYTLAGMVIDNYEGYIDVLSKAGEILKKGIRKIDFIVQTDDIASAEKLFNETSADTVIGENMNYHDFKKLNDIGYADKNLMFHYQSRSMESDIFVLTNFGEIDGAVLTAYDANSAVLNFENIFTKYSSLPTFGYKMPTKFMVTVPADDMSTYYDGIFVTGTGATDGVVNINGVDYPAQYDGTFGVFVNLEPGENLLTIKAAYGTHTRKVTRKIYSSSGNEGGSWTTPWDDTVKLDKGRVVQTFNPLTSVLSDPDDDSAIIAGLEPGTLLQVIDSAETKRSGEKTYAYELSNGGYVLAQNVEITNYITSEYTPPKKNKKQKVNTAARYELISQPLISTVNSSVLDSGDEVMNFAVNSKPAVFSHLGDNALTLHFLDTEITDIQLPQSDFFSEYSVIQQANGVRIIMNYSGEKQLWGYDISAEDGIVKLYLKQAPHLSQDDKPLTGVTIMLDAGHGGGDSGALGVAGIEGVKESQLNLAVAKASAALLKEYGADVVMTRDDIDTFIELEERRSLVRSVKPDLFISVHHNSMDYSYDSNKAYGSECYYFTHQSKQLADLMSKNVSRATNRRDRGEKTGYYYVTRTDIAPSVLMEYSFIINPRDYSTTYSDIDIYRAAWGTVQAILKAIPQ